MPVDPNDLLIFKMRGMVFAEEKQRVVEKPVTISAPRVQPEPRRKPLLAPREEKKAKRGELPSEELSEDEQRMLELRKLEEIAQLHEEAPSGPAATTLAVQSTRNVFAVLSGFLFIINSAVFGYFIYPQAIFIAKYIQAVGIQYFLFNWNYAYGISFINLVFVFLCLVCGLLTLINVRKSNIICTATGSVMLMTVSFEYLNSSTTYLLAVTMIAFASIIALAYARMSAVRIVEMELPTTSEPIPWPRIETF